MSKSEVTCCCTTGTPTRTCGTKGWVVEGGKGWKLRVEGEISRKANATGWNDGGKDKVENSREGGSPPAGVVVLLWLHPASCQ